MAEASSPQAVLRPRPLEVFPGSYAVGLHHIHDHGIHRTPSRAPSHSATHDYAPSESDAAEFAAMAMVLPVASTSFRGAIRDMMCWGHWTSYHVWKAGVVEAAASAAFAYITGSIAVTVSSYPPFIIGPAIFLANTVCLALFIYGIAPASGAHINPLISISTAFTGLCPPSRAIIYVICQCAGASFGGLFLRLGLGIERSRATHNGGCWLIEGGDVSLIQAASHEFMAAFALLFLSYGVGLDPRQKELYGAALGPVLVGATVGLLTFSTSALSPGYTGVSIFPGRCFGLAAGMGYFQKSHWVWWFPDIAAAIVHSAVYHFAPPYTQERPQQPPVGDSVSPKQTKA